VSAVAFGLVDRRDDVVQDLTLLDAVAGEETKIRIRRMELEESNPVESNEVQP
jgi:hypothetical protein